MEARYHNTQGGFVALITAVVFSVVLLAMTISLSQAGFFARSALSDTEYKERSVALAEACADSAILKLAVGASISPGEVIYIGNDSCTITTTTYAAGVHTVNTRAQFQNAVTKLEVKANDTTFAVISWKETP